MAANPPFRHLRIVADALGALASGLAAVVSVVCGEPGKCAGIDLDAETRPSRNADDTSVVLDRNR
jgi:hypothetical protein